MFGTWFSKTQILFLFKVVIYLSLSSYVLDDNVIGDIALMKFDKPFDSSTWGTDRNKHGPNPVCLPSSSFKDEGSEGFVLGLGLEYQKTCRTNGGGPERYKQCAPGGN